MRKMLGRQVCGNPSPTSTWAVLLPVAVRLLLLPPVAERTVEPGPIPFLHKAQLPLVDGGKMKTERVLWYLNEAGKLTLLLLLFLILCGVTALVITYYFGSCSDARSLR